MNTKKTITTSIFQNDENKGNYYYFQKISTIFQMLNLIPMNDTMRISNIKDIELVDKKEEYQDKNLLERINRNLDKINTFNESLNETLSVVNVEHSIVMKYITDNRKVTHSYYESVKEEAECINSLITTIKSLH